MSDDASSETKPDVVDPFGVPWKILSLGNWTREEVIADVGSWESPSKMFIERTVRHDPTTGKWGEPYGVQRLDFGSLEEFLASERRR